MSIISEEKREANRANAQKSTGPRSAAGKLASRLNALKHGLCAEQARCWPARTRRTSSR